MSVNVGLRFFQHVFRLHVILIHRSSHFLVQSGNRSQEMHSQTFQSTISVILNNIWNLTVGENPQKCTNPYLYIDKYNLN